MNKATSLKSTIPATSSRVLRRFLSLATVRAVKEVALKLLALIPRGKPRGFSLRNYKIFLTFYPLYPLILIFVVMWQKTRRFRYLFNFPNCRFYPSCSDYFIQSIQKHGAILGLGLGIKRILKCHPLCSGGIDEVPS